MAKISDIAPVQKAGAAVDLKKLAAGSRLSFTKFGVSKSLTDAQREKAAEAFEAKGDYIRASRCLVDTKHEAWKAVSRVFSQCKDYWKSLTLPYPEPGVRLIRQSHIASFEQQMAEFQGELKEAVDKLEERFHEVKANVKKKAGKLYNEQDYPATIKHLFKIEFEYPNLEPPEYLRKLSPELYAKEEARIQAKFTEAVALAEQAFASEFHKLISHLGTALSGNADGQKKVFKDSAVENLTDFFDRFKTLSVRSNEGLDKLIEDAKSLVKGVAPDDLRTNEELRTNLSKNMSDMSKRLEVMLVDAPKRKVKRAAKTEDE